MEIKVLEIRDAGTFIPVRDGYRGDWNERCIIMIDAQCRGVAYDPYDWKGSRTKAVAHNFIEDNWHDLRDGDVIDVEYILGETCEPKRSEREFRIGGGE